mgnify:FL=1
MATPQSDPVLSVAAQRGPHFPARIVGTTRGLSLLKAAVDAALRDGIGRAEVEAADGYKYTVVVAGASDMDAIPLGYTEPEYADARAFPAWLGDDAE